MDRTGAYAPSAIIGFAMGASRRTSFTMCATVDKIEDAKSREFNESSIGFNKAAASH
jgi:hypothetical protein